MKTHPRVVILGGGFGGLETAFYLRHKLHDRVEITLVSDRDYFLFKPNTIYVPFGEDPEKFKIYLDKPTRMKNIEFVRGSAEGIDPDRKIAHLHDRELSYDYLVVATGADMRPAEIPGLTEHAITVWTPEEMVRLRDAYGSMVEKARGGERQKLVYLIPPNNRCSGPLYEMILMTDTWLRTQKVRELIDLTWTTYEESYIQAFGPRLNTVITDEFEERGIVGHTGYAVNRVEPGTVVFENGEQCAYDLLVSFPPYIAGTRYASLPTDDRGFLHVEADSRRVIGTADIFAVGDTADFPIKQAFLALLQADAAADHIAADIAGNVPSVVFTPISMCVMEEFNKATFAQVPLKYTGNPAKPVTVDTADDHYRVGVSPIWRLGKMVLGMYMPWRFGNGEPFHAGLGWEAMDMGLKVMSKVLAKEQHDEFE